MKEFIVWAVDGTCNLSGCRGTLYLMKLAGIWCWQGEVPRLKQLEPDGIFPNYTLWLSDCSQPYKVRVQYVPEVLTVEKI